MKGNDYSAKEAQKEGEVWAQKIGSKIDNTVGYLHKREASILISLLQVEDARRKLHETDAELVRKAREAEDKLSSYTKSTLTSAEKAAEETRKEAHDAVDKFDKTVERKASEAKNGIASWFGFK